MVRLVPVDNDDDQRINLQLRSMPRELFARKRMKTYHFWSKRPLIPEEIRFVYASRRN
jgi:hypothetical protein